MATAFYYCYNFCLTNILLPLYLQMLFNFFQVCHLQLPHLLAMGVPRNHCEKILENVNNLRQTMFGEKVKDQCMSSLMRSALYFLSECECSWSLSVEGIAAQSFRSDLLVLPSTLQECVKLTSFTIWSHFCIATCITCYDNVFCLHSITNTTENNCAHSVNQSPIYTPVSVTAINTTLVVSLGMSFTFNLNY